MALFFKERMDEQIEDPAKDMINFSHTWIMGVPSPNGNGARAFGKRFRTTYNICSEQWFIFLSENSMFVNYFSTRENDDIVRIWNGSCCISYKLFYDNDMRFEFHSSKIVSATFSHNSCETPAEFTKKFYDAYKVKKIAKIVVFVELVLPAKYFYRPLSTSLGELSEKNCDEYPENMEQDFRFQFLKLCDFSIQCPDGSVSAVRSTLNLTSKFMKQHFKKSKDDKLVVEHSIDVMKPLILYIHSLCFEMPKSFNLDFADRLLKAIEYYEPVYHSDIITTIYQALCNKFVEETPNFNALLQWLSISRQHSLEYLQEMICVLLAKKYIIINGIKHFLKMQERNVGNPLFRDIFGSEGDNNDFQRSTFRLINNIFYHSLYTKVILQ